MPDKEPWYTNKQLFEQILSMKEDFASLRTEMKQTRETIKKYNGLYEKVANVTKEVEHLKAEQEGKIKLQQSIISWGGWLVGLASLLVTLYNVFG